MRFYRKVKALLFEVFTVTCKGVFTKQTLKIVKSLSSERLFVSLDNSNIALQCLTMNICNVIISNSEKVFANTFANFKKRGIL